MTSDSSMAVPTCGEDPGTGLETRFERWAGLVGYMARKRHQEGTERREIGF
jgi:hypothetical protein